MTYEQAYKDHRYLWQEYGSAYDMTGGYVDSDDLDKMLKNPTKRQAKECLCNQISYWFQKGVDVDYSDDLILDGYSGIPERAKEDKKVQEIAERHGCEL